MAKKKTSKKKIPKRRVSKKKDKSFVKIILSIVVVIIIIAIIAVWIGLTIERVNAPVVAQICEAVCAAGNREAWCGMERAVVFDKTGDDNVDNRIGWKCAQLVYKGIGLEDCSAFNCVRECSSVNLNGPDPDGECIEIGCSWDNVLGVCDSK